MSFFLWRKNLYIELSYLLKRLIANDEKVKFPLHNFRQRTCLKKLYNAIYFMQHFFLFLNFYTYF